MTTAKLLKPQAAVLAVSLALSFLLSTSVMAQAQSSENLLLNPVNWARQSVTQRDIHRAKMAARKALKKEADAHRAADAASANAVTYAQQAESAKAEAAAAEAKAATLQSKTQTAQTPTSEAATTTTASGDTAAAQPDDAADDAGKIHVSPAPVNDTSSTPSATTPTNPETPASPLSALQPSAAHASWNPLSWFGGKTEARSNTADLAPQTPPTTDLAPAVETAAPAAVAPETTPVSETAAKETRQSRKAKKAAAKAEAKQAENSDEAAPAATEAAPAIVPDAPAAAPADNTTSTAAPVVDLSPTDVRAIKSKAVVVETEKGDITFILYPDQAPLTVANFIKLVNDGFYNKFNMRFHRVVDKFVIQTGDPTGTGAGGSKDRIPLEVKNKLSHNGKGIVAMARGPEPDSATSQFYITLKASTFLDGKYAIFGKVIAGNDVLDKIQLNDMMYGVHFVDLSTVKKDEPEKKKFLF